MQRKKSLFGLTQAWNSGFWNLTRLWHRWISRKILLISAYISRSVGSCSVIICWWYFAYKRRYRFTLRLNDVIRDLWEKDLDEASFVLVIHKDISHGLLGLSQKAHIDHVLNKSTWITAHLVVLLLLKGIDSLHPNVHSVILNEKLCNRFLCDYHW